MICSTPSGKVHSFQLSLDARQGARLRDLQNLVKRGKSEYPLNPIGYNLNNQWGGISLTQARKELTNVCYYRYRLISHLEDLYYNKYKEANKRISKQKESFVRCVIVVALNRGFTGTIISVSDSDLYFSDIKKTAARDALKCLHDLGLVIYLAGHGSANEGINISYPSAFMIYPEKDAMIEDTIAKLEHGKINVSAINNITI